MQIFIRKVAYFTSQKIETILQFTLNCIRFYPRNILQQSENDSHSKNRGGKKQTNNKVLDHEYI